MCQTRHLSFILQHTKDRDRNSASDLCDHKHGFRGGNGEQRGPESFSVQGSQYLHLRMKVK